MCFSIPIVSVEATSYYFPRRIRMWHKTSEQPLQIENLDKEYDLSLTQPNRENVVRLAIYVAGDKPQLEHLDNLIESCPNLERLTITTHGSYYRINRSLSKLTKLKQLKLSGIVLDPLSLGSLTNLQHLELRFEDSLHHFSKKDIDQQSYVELGANLAKLVHLETLSLSSFLKLDNQSTANLIDALQNLPALKTLTLQYDFLDRNALSRWNSAPFVSRGSLRELHLPYMRLDSERLGYVAMAMPQFANLTFLNLAGSSVDVETADNLFLALSNTIQHLDLSQTTSEQCHQYGQLFDFAHKAENLTTLDLSHSTIGDEGIQKLALAIQEGALDQITKLLLTKVGMTAHGAASLENVLPRLSKLKHLSVDGNLLGDEGVNSLISVR
jgi:Ran GTPase-activating protein (RanGAP) involved in mRNA processing and transport